MLAARIVLLLAATALSGCVAATAARTATGAAVFTTKTAVKGTAGAGRLAARGTGAVLGAGRDDD